MANVLITCGIVIILAVVVVVVGGGGGIVVVTGGIVVAFITVTVDVKLEPALRSSSMK